MAKNPAAVELGRQGGLAKSKKKSDAVKRNGKKGGRPVEWRPIETAPTKGRRRILLNVPGCEEPQIAYSNTWWAAGFSVECKPTHWKPFA